MIQQIEDRGLHSVITVSTTDIEQIEHKAWEYFVVFANQSHVPTNVSQCSVEVFNNDWMCRGPTPVLGHRVTWRCHQIFSWPPFSWSWYVSKHIICVIDTRSLGLARRWKPRQLFSVKGKEGHRGGLIIKLISARFDQTTGNVALLQAHYEGRSLGSVKWANFSETAN